MMKKFSMNYWRIVVSLALLLLKVPAIVGIVIFTIHLIVVAIDKRWIEVPINSLYILMFAMVRYFIPPDRYDLIICIVVFLIFIFLFNKSNVTFKINAAYLSLFFLVAAFQNQAQFHRTFRASTYESYIRAKYDMTQQYIADSLIDKFKQIDTAKSSYFLKLAIEKGDEDEALGFYNKAIENNPDDGLAYDARGYYKLGHKELNNAKTYEALKDFRRALILNPNNADALIHRGFSYILLGEINDACNDFYLSEKLKPSIETEDLIRKHCNNSENLPVPLNP